MSLSAVIVSSLPQRDAKATRRQLPIRNFPIYPMLMIDWVQWEWGTGSGTGSGMAWHPLKLVIGSAGNSCGGHLLYGWLANVVIK